MGLDINFYKTKISTYEKYKEDCAKWEETEGCKEDPDWERRPCINDIAVEVGYFRKVNFLVRFFNYAENCSFREIPECELGELVLHCAKVLEKKNEKTSKEFLPTISGFFFGSIDYDDNYYNSVEKVKEWAEEVLANLDDDDILLMYCWW